MIVMKNGSSGSKKKNKGTMNHRKPKLRSKFRIRHLESLGLSELPSMKNLNAESMINNVDAAMTHEGLPLTRENKQMMRDCIAGRISIQDAKAAMIAKHSRTGTARNYDR